MQNATKSFVNGKRILRDNMVKQNSAYFGKKKVLSMINFRSLLRKHLPSAPVETGTCDAAAIGLSACLKGSSCGEMKHSAPGKPVEMSLRQLDVFRN